MGMDTGSAVRSGDHDRRRGCVEGSDVTEEKVVAEIRKQLGMPPLEPEKKGILGRLFK